jgi:alkanesulfonate monooxygenase SsuD/methylene tetrahydromethanopterin reductase-like flavin-dependent oxidoreductase (luciferase family)
MTTVRIGVTLPQFTDDARKFVSGVERAEKLGFDSLWLFDHLWPLGGKRERPILECWTTLSYLAGISDAEIGTLVTRASLRHPAILAKMAATVGSIASERLIVAIGSGDHMNKGENVAFGAPYFSGGRRVKQLISTLEVVQRFLRTPTADLQDAYVTVKDLPASPKEGPPPRVWVGGRSVELLEVAGRIADGWNGWGANLDTFADDAAKVLAIAGERPFKVSWAGQVILGADDADAHAKLGQRDPAQYVVGGPETVRTQLGRAIGAGASHLIVALPDAGLEGNYEALAEAVEPLRTG